jgi:hypothetical protein
LRIQPTYKTDPRIGYPNVLDTISGQRAGVAQLVERQLPKLKVAGSIPVARF